MTIRNWLADEPERPPINAEFAEHIQAHRLSGLLYHIGARLGEPIATSCKNAWVNNTASYLKRFAALRSIWPPNASPPLLMKGADYVDSLYKSPGARRSADLDLLVFSKDYELVRDAFQEYPIAAAPSYERLPGEPLFAEGFLVDDILIEVHRSPAPKHNSTLETDGLYGRSAEAVVDGFTVRYPHCDDRFLLWLLNQSKTAFVDGIWSLIDLALILKNATQGTDPVDLDTMRDHAQRYGMANAFDLALFRLDQAGIWPHSATRSHDSTSRLISHFCIHRESPTILAPAWRRQALKLWLCPAETRPAMARRMLNRTVDLVRSVMPSEPGH